MKRSLLHLSVTLAFALTLPTFGQQTITTFAGSGPADDSLATVAGIGCPCFVTSADGNVYISSAGRHRVFKVDGSGGIFTVAGIDLSFFLGDGGPATMAALVNPAGIARDSTGNLYLADDFGQRVRKIDLSGIITTVAGTGSEGYNGDGIPATSAQLSHPQSVAVDSMDNLYIAEGDRIRKVDRAGIISTVAGNGTLGFGGDGGPATSAALAVPRGIAVQGKNLYIADTGNERIRKVNAAGIIATVSGSGVQGFSGDGGPAALAALFSPSGVAVRNGNIYIADKSNLRIRKVNGSGKISTIAGNGTPGDGGDGGLATSAQLGYPQSVALDGSGNLYISGETSQHIRKVNPAGAISSIAGDGQPGLSGDGGPATKAQLTTPFGAAADGHGNLFIADTGNGTIRKVDSLGQISTVAGNGTAGFSGDGGPALDAAFNEATAVAVDSHGNLYIVDAVNQRVRKVDTAGIISTVAGNGHPGFAGDGGAATRARLHNPLGVVVDNDGNLYIADQNNNSVRKVDTAGIITTVAKAKEVSAVALDHAGNLYFTDPGHHRLQKRDTSGTISTVAGNKKLGFSGDGGPATKASFSGPSGVAVDAAGNIYITDTIPAYRGFQPGNDRVRKVDTSGIITTFVGTGSVGLSGDGGSPGSAQLAFPNGVTVDADGNLYIADTGNYRIRKVPTATPAGNDGK